MGACSEDDDFSGDAGLKLMFSTNTISFDTLFSTIGSSTREFKIYNKNNKSLTIESIELMNASNSGFRMNIDGQKGNKLTNVDVLKNDSISGFVEITVNPLNNNNPVYIKDSIRFVTNGNVQYIHLEAIGQDVHIWDGKVVSRDTTLTGEKPFIIYDSLRVNANVTLSLKENVHLYFHNKASMRVYGKLEAKGTIRQPIIFRGDRFDNIEAGIPYDNVPGQWEGIFFYNSSQDNHFENVRMRNSSKGILVDGDRSMQIINTIIHNNVSNGLSVINGRLTIINSQISNSAGSCVKLVGGTYNFVHCTFANYYSWGNRNGGTLSVADGNGLYAINCKIVNSIIYGTSRNEIDFNRKGILDFKYSFINCLIKAENIDNNFINSIHNANPLFRDLNTDGKYSYDFLLSKGSPAIGTADKSYVSTAPTDLNGNFRSSDSPDIGCYEYFAE